MMIGPEPTIRMRCRSLRRGMLRSALHQLHEIVEQVMRIVRPGRRLRVILHAEDGMVAMPETFQRLVVQIGMRDLDFVEVEGVGIDGEAMIMRSDLDAPGDFVEHGMIRAAMTELQL